MQITDPRTGIEVVLRNSGDYWNAITAAKTCDHGASELRCWTNKNGSTAACAQCERCGIRVGNPQGGISHARLPKADPEIAVAWERSWRAACEAITIDFIDRQAVEDGDWQAQYEQYRQTQAWRDRRALVLKRCGGICEGCGIAAATEVHHITYDHVMEEFLFELQGLCGPCHARWHEVSR